MGVRVVFPDMGKDPSVQLIEKTITENGTYDAITDGANGYSKVTVNVEGGGGTKYETVFEGNVTTVATDDGVVGNIQYGYAIDADKIKVTFNGTEYECDKISAMMSNIYGGLGEDGPDFSEYPFVIVSNDDGNKLFTESAGSYSLKIETSNESGSGGNFNVAELTVVNNTSRTPTIYAPISSENGTTSGLLLMPNMGDTTVNVILGDEGCFIEFDTSTMVIECSGGISRQTSNPNTFRMRDTATITIVRIEE